jgi:hypothetical protein
MAPDVFQPKQRTLVAAVFTVAATYAYFLLFAQFGFLQIVATVAGDAATGPILGTMGLAGIGGTILGARGFRAEHARGQLLAGLALAAVAAGGARGAGTTAGLHLVAALTGLGTGFTTTVLACGLRRAVGDARLGIVTGLGTGLAYGGCNLPAVFAAGGPAQAGIAVCVAGGGIVAASWLDFGAPREVPAGMDYAPAGQAAWTLLFLVLVALDSAAFAIIQHTSALKAATWTGAGQLGRNALMHVVAAVLAGRALDRRRLGRTVAAGALALLVALGLMAGGPRDLAVAALCYAAGVSVYSTVLVFYPARGARPWLVALVYGVAGWGGSAFGIALAAGRSAVPPGWTVGAGGVIFAVLVVRDFFRRRERTAGS